ncbi:MAG: DUF6624 domain-containing protein [Fimbriimonas sp.]
MILLPQISHLDLVPTGFHDRRSPGASIKLELKDTAPGRRESVITLGGRTYRLTLTERSYGPPLLGIDRDGDGKVGPQEERPMDPEQAVDQDGNALKFYRAKRLIPAPFGRVEVGLSFSYAPKYPSFYAFVDFGRRGTVALGRRRLRAELQDRLHQGDFSLPPDAKGNGIRLRLDLNENGKFDSRGEDFIVGKPFRIDGQVYEARVPRADGAQVEIRPTTADVAEVPPPYIARRGEPLPAFSGTTLDGKSLRYPDDFRGKPLLVDFVGRWSNETEAAAPALAELHRTTGLPIVAVGIDYPDYGPKLAEHAQKLAMTWPILFDKEGWSGPIAQALNVTRIPARFLVDGATGKLLATPEELDNDHLAGTLERLGFKPTPEVRKLAEIQIPADVRDKALYREVERRVREDQRARLHSGSGGDPEGLFEWWEEVDRENLQWLKGLLAKRGWPGKSVLGEKGSNKVWLMVQHCDRDRPFQMFALELLAKAVKKGEASGQNLAYLTDRVRVGMGQPQVYGTQMTSAGGWLRAMPVEDPANVDKRRAEVGLGPLEEYVRKSAEQFRLPTSPPKKGG